MRKNLYYAIAAILAPVVIYAAVAFVLMKTDTRLWSEDARFLFILFAILLEFMIIYCRIIVDKD